MQATVDRCIYRLSVDCVIDTSGRLWQAVDVTRGVHGQLSVTLDTNPIQARIYCYTTDDGWRACDARGNVVIADTEVLAYLAEIQRAILGEV